MYTIIKAVLCFLLCVVPCYGATCYVNTVTGDDSKNCSTAELARKTIRPISSWSEGDTYIVDGSNVVHNGLDNSSPSHDGNNAYYDGSWHTDTNDHVFYIFTVR